MRPAEALSEHSLPQGGAARRHHRTNAAAMSPIPRCTGRRSHSRGSPTAASRWWSPLCPRRARRRRARSRWGSARRSRSPRRSRSRLPSVHRGPARISRRLGSGGPPLAWRPGSRSRRCRRFTAPPLDNISQRPDAEVSTTPLCPLTRAPRPSILTVEGRSSRRCEQGAGFRERLFPARRDSNGLWVSTTTLVRPSTDSSDGATPTGWNRDNASSPSPGATLHRWGLCPQTPRIYRFMATGISRCATGHCAKPAAGWERHSLGDIAEAVGDWMLISDAVPVDKQGPPGLYEALTAVGEQSLESLRNTRLSSVAPISRRPRT